MVSRSIKSKFEKNSLPIITHFIGIFLFFIGPLIMLFITKDRQAMKHVRVSLNWHLSALIYGVVIAVFTLVFSRVSVFAGISTILFFMHVAFSLVATLKASEGELWKYPLSINFFSVKE